MFTVDTSRPLYWKASVLDRFDGQRWLRAQVGDATAAAERNARRSTPGAGLNQLHPGWVQDASFRIEGLQTSLVIGAGTPLSVTDSVDFSASADGTLVHPGGTLEGSTEYKIVTYDPDPTVEQLQAAPNHYSTRRFASTTLLGIPPADWVPAETLAVPTWGKHNAFADERLRSSPYGDVYQLAQAWTASATTPYEAVTEIESHLRRDYAYSPDVPNHPYPLESFLFEDKAGYCQQFAGSMALMLRMLGIPARVVSGFAPGSPNSDNGSYVVHDFDAHSWVEVYFRGIGWVTFDPTPAAAPAESQRFNTETPERRGGALTADGASGDTQGGHNSLTAGDATGATNAGDSGMPAGLIVLAVFALGAVVAIVVYRRRGRIEGDPSDAQVAELRNALDRVGWHIAAGTTLLELERRVAAAGRQPVARYARMLRDHRYAGDNSPRPSEEQRRAMRRALIAGGPLRRWRAWLLVPPGGPRPQR
jgi:transglutaminase-like putative cysteine protease